MKFTKMQGCGNDYIYVNGFEEDIPGPAGLARRLSDRRYGIGSDGLIIIGPSDAADAFMHMYNRDGSESEMCGNGIRCVTKYIYDYGLIPEDRRTAVIETLAGLRTVSFEVSCGKVSLVTVDMGIARPDGALPEELEVSGMRLSFIGIDVGNPHAVFFLEDNKVLLETAARQEARLQDLPIERFGPAIEVHPRFPNRVNAEFIEILHPDEVNFRVWERGSGETLACGTGATASVAAGVLAGKLKPEVLVHLAGGDLWIRYEEASGRCFMTGEAVTVYEGEIAL